MSGAPSPSFRLPHATRLVDAVFLERVNRFVVRVRLAGSGRVTEAHLANTGRLRELLLAGTPALLEPARGSGRKTRFDLALVKRGRLWVHVDSRLANRFAAAALEAGALPPFRGCRVEMREPALGRGRLDFLLEGEHGPVWIEVKSVNLVRGRTALFPDAPTERGRRHLDDLARMARRGEGAHALFFVQRPDADKFMPNKEMDPLFARAAARAGRAGVGLHAWRLHADRRSTRLGASIPVEI